MTVSEHGKAVRKRDGVCAICGAGFTHQGSGQMPKCCGLECSREYRRANRQRPPVTRESRGMGEPSAFSYNVHLTLPERRSLEQYRDPPTHWRPTTRKDCLPGGGNAERPCPFVSCRQHLALEASSKGIRLTFPDKEIGDMAETCALDVADRGPQTLEDIGVMMNVTRERCRQIEARAMRRIKLDRPPDYAECAEASMPDPGVNRGQKWNRIEGRK